MYTLWIQFNTTVKWLEIPPPLGSMIFKSASPTEQKQNQFWKPHSIRSKIGGLQSFQNILVVLIIWFFQDTIWKNSNYFHDWMYILLLYTPYLKPYGMRFSKLVLFLFFLKNWVGDALLKMLSLDLEQFGKSLILFSCVGPVWTTGDQLGPLGTSWDQGWAVTYCFVFFTYGGDCHALD